MVAPFLATLKSGATYVKESAPDGMVCGKWKKDGSY